MFCIEFSGLPPPEFIITMNGTTSITVQITGSYNSNWEYQISTSLQPSGEHIRTQDARFRLMTETIPNLYPFTMYRIELRVRSSHSEPWSYPVSREAKTLEEGIVDIQLLKINVDNY